MNHPLNEPKKHHWRQPSNRPVNVCVECGITIPDTHVLLELTPKQLAEVERKYRSPCTRLDVVDDTATITCTEIGAAAPLNPPEQA